MIGFNLGSTKPLIWLVWRVVPLLETLASDGWTNGLDMGMSKGEALLRREPLPVFPLPKVDVGLS